MNILLATQEVRTQAVDILRDAQERIRDIKNWTIGKPAVDSDGFLVVTYSPKACKWCATGTMVLTVYKKSPTLEAESLAYKTINDIAAQSFPDSSYRGTIVWINDYIGHDAVIAIFDKAIANLTQQHNHDTLPKSP